MNYTSPNGVRVGLHRDPLSAKITVSMHDGQSDSGGIFHVTNKQFDALGEAFRAREDERLGRWRSKENPDFVVYEPDSTDGKIKVVYEPGGGHTRWLRSALVGDLTEWRRPAKVAQEYFDAHPAGPTIPTEPGAYQDDHGDVWVLHKSGAWYHNGDGSLAVEWTREEMLTLPANRTFTPLVKLEAGK